MRVTDDAHSFLKDKRLTYYLGDVYRVYQKRVPGFPLVPFGPLARRPAGPAGTASAPQFPQPVSRRNAT